MWLFTVHNIRIRCTADTALAKTSQELSIILRLLHIILERRVSSCILQWHSVCMLPRTEDTHSLAVVVASIASNWVAIFASFWSLSLLLCFCQNHSVVVSVTGTHGFGSQTLWVCLFCSVRNGLRIGFEFSVFSSGSVRFPSLVPMHLTAWKDSTLKWPTMCSVCDVFKD